MSRCQEITHSQDVLELGRITGEQGYVQHPLGDGLLGGVPVAVQLGLQQRGVIIIVVIISRQGKEHSHS